MELRAFDGTSAMVLNNEM